MEAQAWRDLPHDNVYPIVIHSDLQDSNQSNCYNYSPSVYEKHRHSPYYTIPITTTCFLTLILSILRRLRNLLVLPVSRKINGGSTAGFFFDSFVRSEDGRLLSTLHSINVDERNRLVQVFEAKHEDRTTCERGGSESDVRPLEVRVDDDGCQGETDGGRDGARKEDQGVNQTLHSCGRSSVRKFVAGYVDEEFPDGWQAVQRDLPPEADVGDTCAVASRVDATRR